MSHLHYFGKARNVVREFDGTCNALLKAVARGEIAE
jgi:hypothetical protein